MSRKKKILVGLVGVLLGIVIVFLACPDARLYLYDLKGRLTGETPFVCGTALRPLDISERKGAELIKDKTYKVVDQTLAIGKRDATKLNEVDINDFKIQFFKINNKISIVTKYKNKSIKTAIPYFLFENKQVYADKVSSLTSIKHFYGDFDGLIYYTFNTKQNIGALNVLLLNPFKQDVKFRIAFTDIHDIDLVRYKIFKVQTDLPERYYIIIAVPKEKGKQEKRHFDVYEVMPSLWEDYYFYKIKLGTTQHTYDINDKDDLINQILENEPEIDVRRGAF